MVAFVSRQENVYVPEVVVHLFPIELLLRTDAKAIKIGGAVVMVCKRCVFSSKQVRSKEKLALSGGNKTAKMLD